MKQSLSLTVLLLGLTLGGCASQPRIIGDANIGDQPQVRLPGADLEHGQLLAMGMARSNGWQIVKKSPNQLILERPLPPTSPQAVALGLETSAVAPTIQVQTDFGKSGGDVVVALRSFVIANPGTEQEQRIDYTADYQDALMISLNSLESAWLANRAKLTSEIPLPPQDAVMEPAGAEIAGADTDEESSFGDASFGDAASAQLDDASSVGPTPAPTTVATTSPPQDPGAGNTVAMAATTEPIPADAAQSTPSALPSGTVSAADPAMSASNDMLVLNADTRKGLWAYYAEDYARMRGCAISERGAVLLQQTPAFELHEVQCDGSANYLVRCQGGVCREMQ